MQKAWPDPGRRVSAARAAAALSCFFPVKTVLSTMFFEELSFLPISFRKELKASIEAQMKEFDKSFKKDMMNAAVENPGSELESAVTLISYIRLFD